MSGLLPSKSEASPEQPGNLQTLWLDSDEAGDLLSCLSSETARAILMTLHEEPATASEVSDRVDTSLQNARHHLDNLQEAGVVRVADTKYSSKGREMDVYAPSEDPMVVFVGNEEESSAFESLKQLLPVVGLLGVASLLVEWFVGFTTGTAAPAELPRFTDGTGDAVGPAVGLPPGLIFFAGGLLVLASALLVRRYGP
jgi:DNA-binding transcriptional ArsR family regulator